MSNTPQGNYHGQGGSYRVDADGKVERVEAPTQDHPLGNRPRDAQGKALDLPDEIPAAQPSPEAPPVDPAPRSTRRMASVPTSDNKE